MLLKALDCSEAHSLPGRPIEECNTGGNASRDIHYRTVPGPYRNSFLSALPKKESFPDEDGHKTSSSTGYDSYKPRPNPDVPITNMAGVNMTEKNPFSSPVYTVISYGEHTGGHTYVLAVGTTLCAHPNTSSSWHGTRPLARMVTR